MDSTVPHVQTNSRIRNHFQEIHCALTSDRASVARASESFGVLGELQYLLIMTFPLVTMLSLDGDGLNNAQTSYLHVHVFYHGCVRVDIEFMFG